MEYGLASLRPGQRQLAASNRSGRPASAQVGARLANRRATRPMGFAKPAAKWPIWASFLFAATTSLTLWGLLALAIVWLI